jgi:hypothetical protein
VITISDNASVAHVYAGDVASTVTSDARDTAIYVFQIEADAEPGTFARIANVFNFANVPPNHVHLELDRSGRILIIDVEMRLAPNIADCLLRKLTQLTDVLQVAMATPASSASK